MVTKTVISFTQSEAAALAATESWSSAEAESIIKNAPTEQINTKEVLAPLCNRPSCTKRAQHPLVTSGGKKRAHPSAQNASASTSYYNRNFFTTMFPLLTSSFSQHFQPSINQKQHQQNSSEDLSGVDTDTFILDLSDVPPQPTIPKSKGRMIKETSSKYTGVYFDKRMKKWKARIMINGKERRIGHYDNEEEAAADYARAVFKYKGQETLDKARGVEKKSIKDQVAQETKVRRVPLNSFVSDYLSDVPPQPPIPKSKGWIKEGSSKYTGVSFEKARNKWQARIEMGGKFRCIGYYEDEEEAAIDYARAVFKYKEQGALKKQKSNIIDLSDVPAQPPIPKSKGRMKEGSSKYTGVSFLKSRNKWEARMELDGKFRCIGHYEDEEEAAIDYARAVFKYKDQGASKKRSQMSLI